MYILYIHSSNGNYDVLLSERVESVSKFDKTLLKQASGINKSLVTLGNVIQSLGKHLEYRTSRRHVIIKYYVSYIYISSVMLPIH